MVYEEYSAAIAAGDAEQSMALWAEDGIYFPPGAPPIFGWEAIAERTRPYLAQFDTRHEVSSEGIEVRGDLTVNWGTWVQTVVPRAGGDSTVIRAKYLRVLRKQQDGSWRIWRDIWNALPADFQE